MQLLVTADVEGFHGSSDDYRAVDRFDTFLDQFDIPLVIFATPDVVEHRPALVRRWLTESHDLGLHIHPGRFKGAATDRLSEYSAAEIAEMIDAGLDTFDDSLDHRPTAFRAGRWEFSERLLKVLDDRGFRIDASRRRAGVNRPYSAGGIVEVPMTVYTNPVINIALRTAGISGVPLHMDAFVTSRRREVVLYAATWRLLRTDRPYLMVSYHDYDLLTAQSPHQIYRYINWLAKRVTPTGLEGLLVDMGED